MRMNTKFSGGRFRAEATAAPPRNCRNCLRSISGCDHGLQVPSANHARQVLVVTRPAPMRFETHPALVAIFRQRRELPLPIDPALAERTPNRFVPFHMTVLGVDVDDARNRQLAVPVRIWILTGDVAI